MTGRTPVSRLLYLLTTGSCTLVLVSCISLAHQTPSASIGGPAQTSGRRSMASTLSGMVEPFQEQSRTTFGTHCAPCHGATGGGGIGPDLTDAEWRHGGDLQSVRDTIRNGVDNTGMPAWSDSLGPREILGLADYVTRSLATVTPDS